MKSTFLCFTLLLFAISNIFAGNTKQLEWLKSFGGDASSDFHFAGNCDKQGNIYLISRIKSPVVNFGNGNVFNSADTNNNYFVFEKFNNDGICQWFKPVNFFSGEFYFNNIKVDNSGNFIIIGNADILNTNIDFGNGNILTGTSSKSIILIKYSPTGDCIWAKCFDGDSKMIDGMDACFDRQ
jgi:hypothetical protein